jgi:hypothetical protein
MPRQKTETIHIRVDSSFKKAAEQAAKDGHRTITGLIEMLVSEHLEANGYLPKRKRPAGRMKP